MRLFGRERRKERQARREWIRRHFLCPACRAGEELVQRGQDLACNACGTTYEQRSGALDFIAPAMREKFNIVPTDNVSAHRYDPIARGLIDGGGMVLDCGSGKKDVAFSNLIQTEVVDYPLVDVLAVNQRLPFRAEVFDAVLSLDVLEHVDQPFDCAAEILRVLKPGGRIYCNVPFLQREHGYPHHYFGMTRMGIRRVFGDSIRVLEHKVPPSGHPIWALWLMLQTWRDGLPAETRDEFLDLTMRDILARPPVDWLKAPVVQALNQDARWRIATTTTLIAEKIGVTGQAAGH